MQLPSQHDTYCFLLQNIVIHFSSHARTLVCVLYISIIFTPLVVIPRPPPPSSNGPAFHSVVHFSSIFTHTHTHTHGIIIILYWLKNNFVNNIAPKYLVVNTLYKTLRFSPPFEKIWNKLNIWNGFLIFVYTFFHLFKEGAYLRNGLKVQNPVSHACTDLLLPLSGMVSA